MTKKHGDWIAIAKDGEHLLIVPDLNSGEAALYNTLTKKTTEAQPLQVWFKWGIFQDIEPAPIADLQAAALSADDADAES